GESKQLLELTFSQFAPILIEEKLATQTEIDQLATALKQCAEDSTTLVVMPLVGQVWAVK
ncbi:MAG: hypothetical protein ACRDEA_11050, partial [Microcystaceae cyanobacterium]